MSGRPQRTVKGTAMIEGVGLHTGEKGVMTFSPAPVGHGVRFVRIDLPGSPEVQVRQAGRDLHIAAQLSAMGWPVGWLEQDLQVGLSAVLEARSGALSYYSLQHARDVPDFHDRRGWTARLESTVPLEKT